MKRILLTIVLAVIAVGVCSAQNERKSVRQGNRNFRKENFAEAEISYKKALVADSTSVAADYNLGNTYYRMENFTEADKCYQAAEDSLSKGKYGADLFFNMGNSLVKQENYQGAIEAYKKSLRLNPSDMKAKENLTYAKKMLKDQQQNQDQNQDQNQQQNQDQNQNQNQNQNNDQNKDQDNDQNKNQDRNNDNNQDRQDQPGQQPKISPQAAQQMLQAMQAQEKDTQDKVKKEKALRMKSKQKEKNW